MLPASEGGKIEGAIGRCGDFISVISILAAVGYQDYALSVRARPKKFSLVSEIAGCN